MFEDFATLEALIWILTTVDDVVANETRPISEGFSAFFAHKGFFSSVASVMQNKSGAVGEGLSTLTAFIRLLPTVIPLVLRQV